MEEVFYFFVQGGSADDDFGDVTAEGLFQLGGYGAQYDLPYTGQFQQEADGGL
jgi:hypothetical protein